MKKQVRKNNRVKKGISGETAMMLTLNAFVIGLLIGKISVSGISWISTTGLLG